MSEISRKAVHVWFWLHHYTLLVARELEILQQAKHLQSTSSPWTTEVHRVFSQNVLTGRISQVEAIGCSNAVANKQQLQMSHRPVNNMLGKSVTSLKLECGLSWAASYRFVDFELQPC